MIALSVKITLETGGKTESIEAPATVKELVEKLGFNLEEVLVSVNDELVAEDTRLHENDRVKIINVISGG